MTTSSLTSAAVPAGTQRELRVLMYSHDSYGLGHLRRSLILARALAEAHPSTSVLLATGSPCATQFELPPRVEVLKLPSVGKDDAGGYVPRNLALPLGRVLSLRRRLLAETAAAFTPHLLLVDHQPAGLHGELTDALALVRRQGGRTLLGLRDVIDAPEAVARAWADPVARAALESAYDRICIYGSPSVYDLRAHYPVPAGALARMESVGYVVGERPASVVHPLPPDRPQVLVTVGGGEDGAERLALYLRAVSRGHADWDSTLVLGPLLPRAAVAELHRAARAVQGVTVHDFHEDVPGLLASSDAVVGMAGYNTTAEVLQSGVPAVLLPRLVPRQEQRIRARRLADLGLLESLESPTPEALFDAVERCLARPRRRHLDLPLDGAARVTRVVRELLDLPLPQPAAAAVAV